MTSNMAQGYLQRLKFRQKYVN